MEKNITALGKSLEAAHPHPWGWNIGERERPGGEGRQQSITHVK